MRVPLDDVVAFRDAKLKTQRFDEEGANGFILRNGDTVSRVACAVNTSFHARAREVHRGRPAGGPPSAVARDRPRAGGYTKLYARERGVNLTFGAHWATETLGVKVLASQLEARVALPWSFIAEHDDLR